METFPIPREGGRGCRAFEVENAYVSVRAIVRILSGVDGVTDVRPRRLFSRWDEIHVRFKYFGEPYVVWEPFGDNSRYWIGPADDGASKEAAPLEQAFQQHRPPWHWRIAGDLLTLRFLSRVFRDRS